MVERCMCYIKMCKYVIESVVLLTAMEEHLKNISRDGRAKTESTDCRVGEAFKTENYI